MNKAERGELAFALPSGYVRRGDGKVVFDPDEQVQAVIRLIFAKFAEIGTLHGVLRFLFDHDIRLGIRLREGPERGILEWRRVNRMTLQTLLHNPAYAGIYAYGRRRVDPRRKQPGRPATGRVVRDQREWHAMIPGVFPAYISEEQFTANEAKLAANRAAAEAMGPARTGPSLAAGLVWCGRCGKRMTVRYHQQHGVAAVEYWCNRGVTNYGNLGPCQGLSGTCLDTFIENHVLAALAPAALEVSLHAADQVIAEREALEKLWTQRLERARYEAERAGRVYHLAEPENRLVTRQLERDWEQALAARQHLVEEHERFTASHPRTLSPREKTLLRELSGNIDAIWNAPTTTSADRKEIVRAIVERVEVTVIGTTERVNVTITWAGGAATTGEIVRPVQRLDQLSYYPQLVARVRELAAAGHRARGIARILAEEGYRPARAGTRISDSAVQELLRRLGSDTGPRRRRARLPPGEDLGPDEWWLDELATELDMPKPTLYAWIHRGWLHARRETSSPHRLIAHADPDELAALRERRTRPPGWYSRLKWNDGHDPTDTPRSVQSG
jgi:hypothetical protein